MADAASQLTDRLEAADPSMPSGPSNDDLLGELARAMHTAANAQYERMNADLERRRTEQIDAIAQRASAEADRLKANTETDIGAIDAWAKAETEKIKQERLRRIDTRREELAGQLDREETVRQREVHAIEAATDTHRAEIDQFFGRMERETDPTAIANVASLLPPFPPLAEIAEEARRSAVAEFNGLGSTNGIETSPATPTAEALTAEMPAVEALAAEASVGEASTTDSLAEPADVTESRLMAVMDPDATHAANTQSTSPWEAPYAVSVAAGSGMTEAAPAAEAHGRMGSTLLRTVRAIRPLASSDKDDAPR